MTLISLMLFSGCTRSAPTAVQEEQTVATELARQPREGLQTILTLCLDTYEAPRDSGAYRNDHKADFIMLMVIDEARGKTTALQLNPDTLVPFSPQGMAETLEIPLGLVYSYGSGGSDSFLNGSKAVSKLLGGVPIDHYLMFTAESIAVVNDMLGGVTVAVTEDLPEQFQALADGESLTLMGANSTEFFRFRDEADVANEAHMERQRLYMEGMYSPFTVNAQQESFLTQLTLKLGDGMDTDLTLSQMMQMLESLGTNKMDETILTLRGSADKVDGEFQFRVDEDSLEQTVESLFFQ